MAAIVGSRLDVAPRRDRVAGEQVGDHLYGALPAERAERSGDGVGRDEGTWRRVPAELVGDKRQIGEAVAADRAAAVRLTDEQRRPPELGTGAPVVSVEAGRVVS